MNRWIRTLVCTAAFCGVRAIAADESSATAIEALRDSVVLNDPRNPSGMQIRRARRTGEAWPDYFARVMLWPCDAETYQQYFFRLSSPAEKIEFLANTVFEVGDTWYLVVRGTKSDVEAARNAVRLETGDRKIQLSPRALELRRAPQDHTWLGFLAFAKPAGPNPPRIMSSFARFGNAGGVAEIVGEEEACRRFKVLRSLAELIERIAREQAGQKR
jgi:hypothetical protein